jgi:hypothetical protein
MVDEAYFVEDEESGGNQFRMIIYRMTADMSPPGAEESPPRAHKGGGSE